MTNHFLPTIKPKMAASLSRRLFCGLRLSCLLLGQFLLSVLYFRVSKIHGLVFFKVSYKTLRQSSLPPALLKIFAHHSQSIWAEDDNILVYSGYTLNEVSTYSCVTISSLLAGVWDTAVHGEKLSSSWVAGAILDARQVTRPLEENLERRVTGICSD